MAEMLADEVLFRLSRSTPMGIIPTEGLLRGLFHENGETNRTLRKIIGCADQVLGNIEGGTGLIYRRTGFSDYLHQSVAED
jgi:hypothetical protein